MSGARSTRILPYLIPSLAHILFACVLLSLCLVPNRGMLGDGDTGYHIRAGELILQTLSLPRFDPYSFISPTLPWTVHEWLAEVVMALCHQVGGLSGVVAFYAFLLALTYHLFVRKLQAQGVTPLIAVLAAIVVISPSTIHWLARPHVFSLLIIVVWGWILDACEERAERRLYLLPPLMLLWVNLHGGYILGFVILGVYLGGALLVRFTDRDGWLNGGRERAMRYGAATVGCVAAAMVNPFGYKIFLFPFRLVFDKYMMDHVQEFLSPNFHEHAAFKLLLLGMFLVLALSRRRLTFVETVLALFLTNMALYSTRYIPLYGLIVVPIMLRQIGGGAGENFPRTAAFFRERADVAAAVNAQLRGFFWPAATVGLVMVLVWNGTIVHGFDPNVKAVAAVEFLKREHVPGKMFNSDEFGDLVIYEAHRQYKVFIDGRLDMYGSDRVKEYFKIASFSPGWEATLDGYGISWVFYATDTEFVRFLASRQDWRLVYSDKVASILVRATAQHAALIGRYPGVQLARIEDIGNNRNGTP